MGPGTWRIGRPLTSNGAASAGASAAGRHSGTIQWDKERSSAGAASETPCSSSSSSSSAAWGDPARLPALEESSSRLLAAATVGAVDSFSADRAEASTLGLRALAAKFGRNGSAKLTGAIGSSWNLISGVAPYRPTDAIGASLGRVAASAAVRAASASSQALLPGHTGIAPWLVGRSGTDRKTLPAANAAPLRPRRHALPQAASQPSPSPGDARLPRSFAWAVPGSTVEFRPFTPFFSRAHVMARVVQVTHRSGPAPSRLALADITSVSRAEDDSTVPGREAYQSPLTLSSPAALVVRRRAEACAAFGVLDDEAYLWLFGTQSKDDMAPGPHWTKLEHTPIRALVRAASMAAAGADADGPAPSPRAWRSFGRWGDPKVLAALPVGTLVPVSRSVLATSDGLVCEGDLADELPGPQPKAVRAEREAAAAAKLAVTGQVAGAGSFGSSPGSLSKMQAADVEGLGDQALRAAVSAHRTDSVDLQSVAGALAQAPAVLTVPTGAHQATRDTAHGAVATSTSQRAEISDTSAAELTQVPVPFEDERIPARPLANAGRGVRSLLASALAASLATRPFAAKQSRIPCLAAYTAAAVLAEASPASVAAAVRDASTGRFHHSLDAAATAAEELNTAAQICSDQASRGLLRAPPIPKGSGSSPRDSIAAMQVGLSRLPVALRDIGAVLLDGITEGASSGSSSLETLAVSCSGRASSTQQVEGREPDLRLDPSLGLFIVHNSESSGVPVLSARSDLRRAPASIPLSWSPPFGGGANARARDASSAVMKAAGFPGVSSESVPWPWCDAEVELEYLDWDSEHGALAADALLRPPVPGMWADVRDETGKADKETESLDAETLRWGEWGLSLPAWLRAGDGLVRQSLDSAGDAEASNASAAMLAQLEIPDSGVRTIISEHGWGGCHEPWAVGGQEASPGARAGPSSASTGAGVEGSSSPPAGQPDGAHVPASTGASLISASSSPTDENPTVVFQAALKAFMETGFAFVTKRAVRSITTTLMSQAGPLAAMATPADTAKAEVLSALRDYKKLFYEHSQRRSLVATVEGPGGPVGVPLVFETRATFIWVPGLPTDPSTRCGPPELVQRSARVLSERLATAVLPHELVAQDMYSHAVLPSGSGDVALFPVAAEPLESNAELLRVSLVRHGDGEGAAVATIVLGRHELEALFFSSVPRMQLTGQPARTERAVGLAGPLARQSQVLMQQCIRASRIRRRQEVSAAMASFGAEELGDGGWTGLEKTLCVGLKLSVLAGLLSSVGGPAERVDRFRRLLHQQATALLSILGLKEPAGLEASKPLEPKQRRRPRGSAPQQPTISARTRAGDSYAGEPAGAPRPMSRRRPRKPASRGVAAAAMRSSARTPAAAREPAPTHPHPPPTRRWRTKVFASHWRLRPLPPSAWPQLDDGVPSARMALEASPGPGDACQALHCWSWFDGVVLAVGSFRAVRAALRALQLMEATSRAAFPELAAEAVPDDASSAREASAGVLAAAAAALPAPDLRPQARWYLVRTESEAGVKGFFVLPSHRVRPLWQWLGPLGWALVL